MKMRLSLLFAFLFTVTGTLFGQSTAFTYQGRLNDGAGPAHGQYDLAFSLWSTASGPGQIGTTVTNSSVLVSNGLFTASLDFGAGAFSGGNRWIEIAVRTNGNGGFSALVPRQKVTATPYAVSALNADSLDGLDSSGFALAVHSHSASDITGGILTTPRGGLGTDTSGAIGGSLLRASGSGTWTSLAPGADGQVLKLAGGQPAWGPDNNSGGTVTSINTGTGLTGGPIVSSGTIALDTSIVPRLGANNSFTGSNVFNGVLTATNGSNIFGGTFVGNGGSLSNLSANALSGTLPSGILAGTYGNTLALTNGGNSFSGSFSGNGAALTGVNAANLGGQLPAAFWQLNGNAVSPGQFLGSTNDQALELRVNNMRALRLEPNTNGAPNVIGGAPINFVPPGTVGATIGGGGAINYFGFSSSNLVSGAMGTIGGGGNNTVNGFGATIAGGFGNSSAINASGSIISGGYYNLIGDAGFSTSIGGGYANTNKSVFSAIGGGYQNLVDEGTGSSVLGGGYYQVIQNGAYGSFLGGGSQNVIQSNAFLAFLGGGEGNTNGASHAALGGGIYNWIQPAADLSFIGGGLFNVIEPGADQSVIAGGNAHKIKGGARESFIGGGFANVIETNAIVSFIGGGTQNKTAVGASFSVIGGGVGNLAGGSSATIGGGFANAAIGQNATVGGGTLNSNLALSATIAGGQENRATNQYATVGGGYQNVAGGNFNLTGDSATVAGGYQNAALGNNAFVGGGYANLARGDNTAIGGGWLHTNLTGFGTIGGGQQHLIEPFSRFSTIAGGDHNTIRSNSTYAVISGGFQNLVWTNITFATIAGGFSNVINGSYGFAAGRRARVAHPGAFVWADSTDAEFASTATNQFNVRATGGVRLETSGAGATVDGSPILVGQVNNSQIAPGAVNNSSIAAGAVNSSSIANGSVTASDVDPTTFDTTFWKTTGNLGTVEGSHALGTLDGAPMTLMTANRRFLQARSVSRSSFVTLSIAQNLVGGSEYNVISNGVLGATISGGGVVSQTFGFPFPSPNVISDDYGTIGGGYANIAGNSNPTANDAISATVGGGGNNVSSGSYATVPGGYLNTAAGYTSFAAGNQAKALHQGSFVWADSLAADFQSTTNDQFSIRASGGIRIDTNTPSLSFEGPNSSIRFPSTSDSNTPMIYMFGGTANSDRMVLAHSPSFPNLGLKYQDSQNKFHFVNFLGGATMTVNLGNGCVGIGNSNPVFGLDVGGGGAHRADNSPNWTVTSDRRVKRDINSLTNGLATLERLRPVRFHYTDTYVHDHPGSSDKERIGVVAQEFREVFPDYVSEDSSGLLSVDITPMTFYNAAALRELNAELKAKDLKIAELEKRLERLEKLASSAAAGSRE